MIFDWRLFFVNRKWLYTTVTRATELRNVSFCDPKCTAADYAEYALDKYLSKKVDNYIKEDHRRERPINDNYITSDWLKGQFGKVCHDCGDCLRFDINDGRVDSNLSADRVDNSECHHLKNITPMCVSCNQKKVAGKRLSKILTYGDNHVED